MPDADYWLERALSLTPVPVVPALVWVEGLASPDSTPDAAVTLEALIDRVGAAGEEFIPASRRKRVRAMLRHGKYKPSGRGKPASEFLLRAALDDAFPRINGPVDANNIVSLESGFPGSSTTSSRKRG